MVYTGGYAAGQGGVAYGSIAQPAQVEMVVSENVSVPVTETVTYEAPTVAVTEQSLKLRAVAAPAPGHATKVIGVGRHVPVACQQVFNAVASVTPLTNAVKKFEATRSLEVTQSMEASQTLETSQTLEVTQTVEAAQTVEATHIVEASQTLEASQTVEVSQTVGVSHTLEASQTLEATQTLEAAQTLAVLVQCQPVLHAAAACVTPSTTAVKKVQAA